MVTQQASDRITLVPILNTLDGKESQQGQQGLIFLIPHFCFEGLCSAFQCFLSSLFFKGHRRFVGKEAYFKQKLDEEKTELFQIASGRRLKACLYIIVVFE